MGQQCWLLLEKSEAISKGIDGYEDRTGEFYNYDSLVPNAKRVKSGDIVVLRKDDSIVGIGRIGDVASNADIKDHRRCPECKGTDIRERLTKTPRFKCGKCASEFEDPVPTNMEVTAYRAEIVDFERLANPPSVFLVKSCALAGDGPASQLSILELSPALIHTLFEGIQVQDSPRSSASRGQGIGLSAPERKAVELRAMAVVRELFETEGWAVVDTSSSKPYDLRVTKDGKSRFVEVKGTTGSGESILLTSGEVEHARQHPHASSLVVVTGIKLDQSGAAWTAHGGAISCRQEPWVPDDGSLKPTQFRFQISAAAN